jgi:hypothetical protein
LITHRTRSRTQRREVPVHFPFEIKMENQGNCQGYSFDLNGTSIKQIPRQLISVHHWEAFPKQRFVLGHDRLQLLFFPARALYIKSICNITKVETIPRPHEAYISQPLVTLSHLSLCGKTFSLLLPPSPQCKCMLYFNLFDIDSPWGNLSCVSH